MDQQIIDKANYCLNCINKPCSTKGCPMHTQIPEFINKIKNYSRDNGCYDDKFGRKPKPG